MQGLKLVEFIFLTFKSNGDKKQQVIFSYFLQIITHFYLMQTTFWSLKLLYFGYLVKMINILAKLQVKFATIAVLFRVFCKAKCA